MRFCRTLGKQAYHLDVIEPDAHYFVSAISSPIFGSSETPELTIAIGDPYQEMSGSKVLAADERSVAAHLD